VRKIVVILAAAAALVAVTPAAAHQGHGSCKEWAQAGAELAKDGGLGELVSGVAAGGPGAVADLVAEEHAAACSGD
jgi:hypothetical protein